MNFMNWELLLLLLLLFKCELSMSHFFPSYFDIIFSTLAQVELYIGLNIKKRKYDLYQIIINYKFSHTTF